MTKRYLPRYTTTFEISETKDKKNKNIKFLQESLKQFLIHII